MSENAPKRTLKEQVKRVGRRALAVGAAVDYARLFVQDSFEEDTHFQEEARTRLYHIFGRGIKYLEAGWEDWRARQLDSFKNDKLVQRRRGKLERRDGELRAEEGALKEDYAAWLEKVKERVKERNVSVLSRAGVPLTEDVTPTKLFDEIAVHCKFLLEKKRTGNDPFRDAIDSEQAQRFIDQDRREAEALATLKELAVECGGEWSSLLKRDSALMRGRKKLERDARNAGTPEARIMERERLLAEREALHKNLHAVELTRIRYRRALFEKAADIKELMKGEDPGEARTAREQNGMETLAERLRRLRTRSVTFGSLDTIDIFTNDILYPDKENVGPEHPERIPHLREKQTSALLSIEVERLIDAAVLPEGLHKKLHALLPGRYELVVESDLHSLMQLIDEAREDVTTPEP